MSKEDKRIVLKPFKPRETKKAIIGELNSNEDPTMMKNHFCWIFGNSESKNDENLQIISKMREILLFS